MRTKTEFTKTIRIPVEAYQKEKMRLDEINKKLKQLTKNQNFKDIKMTEYFKLRSSKPMFVYDDELLNRFAKKKGRTLI